jgi:hypothetical protein
MFHLPTLDCTLYCDGNSASHTYVMVSSSGSKIFGLAFWPAEGHSPVPGMFRAPPAPVLSWRHALRNVGGTAAVTANGRGENVAAGVGRQHRLPPALRWDQTVTEVVVNDHYFLATGTEMPGIFTLTAPK